MKVLLATAVVVAALCIGINGQRDSDGLVGLSCPSAGYMLPDASNLCFVWFCERAGQAPIKRPCPKGVRVPSWWEGGELAMCNIINIVKHGGEPVCLRCDVNDIRPDDSCANTLNPCEPECTCIDTEHTHRCDCPVTLGVGGDGFVLPPRDHCVPNPCENGASCQNQWDGFHCFCPNGWTGHRCETSVCDWHPCLNGGTCIIEDVGYHCECLDCWGGACCNESVSCVGPGIVCPPCKEGANCEITKDICGCSEDPCITGSGTCVDTPNGPQCQDCPQCRTGKDCKIVVDSCYCNNDCPNNSQCEDLSDVRSHECICKECWTGNNCDVRLTDTCNCSDSCKNGGQCVNTLQGPTCGCDPCHDGQYCQNDVINCQCANTCGPNQACSDVAPGQISCGCENPCRTGSNCDQVVQTCACNDPCQNGGQCLDTLQGPTCDCDACHEGQYCQNNVINCQCANTCGPNQACSDVAPGQIDCGCENPCRTGSNCDQVVQTCACNDPCQNGACYDTASGQGCTCDTCFDGLYCEQSIVSCACANTCSVDETCYDVAPGQISCSCSDSCRTGPGCSEVVNSCECNNPCQNGGQCDNTDSGPVCTCDSCHEGAYCERDIINCACANTCLTGESCYDVSSGIIECGCSDPCRTGPGCTDTVNSCACANPCSAAQECSKVGGELFCSCLDPCSEGTNCDQVKNTCGCRNPCQNGGICSNVGNELQCDGCDTCWAGAYCEQQVVSCDCNSPCGLDQVCNMVNGAPVCGCPPCYTGEYCDVLIDSCECNNQCINRETCQDVNGGTQCVCDCQGNEECRNDPITNQPVCKCPLCYTNQPGASGCLTPVQHLCVCNNPCTADQQVCVDGSPGGRPVCKIGNPSSGNAFTVVFEENDSEKSFREIPLELYLTPSVPNDGNRQVNIRSAGLEPDHHCYFNVNKTIMENSVLRFPVERCMMHNKTGLERLAIRMTELNNDTMLVYGINKDRWTADGFLATPDFQAGSSFQTVSYAPAHISTQFAIVALFDDTDVVIELADDNDLPAPYNTRGSIYRLTMQAFETFQVQARCPNQPPSKRRQCTKDLTGSIITANNKIHVFSGNVRAFVKAGEGLSRDHLVEEMVPTDRWGRQFGLISVPGRAVGDILNIMSLKGEATNVDVYFNNDKQSYSLPMNGKLNKHVEVPSNTRIFIKSDKPLSVTQLTKSKDTYLYSNESVHDPVTITIPPISQFTNNFFISTPYFSGGIDFALQPYQTNLALLVAKKGEEQSITLDGAPLSSFVMPWGDLPMADNGSEELVGSVITLEHGTRLISNTQGHNFQCIIYGFDDRESYGFPAAMNHKAI